MTEGHGNRRLVMFAITLGLCLGIAGPAGADQWGSGSGGGGWVASWAASPEQPIDPLLAALIPDTFRRNRTADCEAQRRRVSDTAAPHQ